MLFHGVRQNLPAFADFQSPVESQKLCLNTKNIDGESHLNNTEGTQTPTEEFSPEILSILLKDRSSQRNLIWATDNYIRYGRGFGFSDCITLEKIFLPSGASLIRPRTQKSREEQQRRIKEKAEVFTPSWICNKQNNLADEAWFGTPSPFNTETQNGWVANPQKIPFPTADGKNWQAYVSLRALEITCGEAPYLASRYDTTTGAAIAVPDRVGILDRKLRVVSENASTEQQWYAAALDAFRSTCGYEWQGDSLFIARQNLLQTFVDCYVNRFGLYPICEYLLEVAEIISWNLWQMDGLKCVVPNSCVKTRQPLQYSIFPEDNIEKDEPCLGCLKGGNYKHTGIYSKIMNWQTKRCVKFSNLRGAKNMKFDFVIGNPPYQVTVKEASEGNNKNTVDVYDAVQSAAKRVARKTCLIYPAKDYQRGKKNLMDKHLLSLRIYNGSSRQTEKHIPYESAVFGDLIRRIPGDVGIVYFDMEKETDQVMYQEKMIERSDKILPVRMDFFPIANKLRNVAGTFHFSEIGKVCESNFVQYHSDSVLKIDVDRSKPTPDGYVKVITNDKAGSGGKAKWYYLKEKDLDRKQPKRYKVIITSAYPNESFGNSKNIEILHDDEFFGRSKMAIYDNQSLQKVESCYKYLQTKFAKFVNLMTPYKFLYYLPDFEAIYSDVDWSKTIAQIDDCLFNKYEFTESEKQLVKRCTKELE